MTMRCCCLLMLVAVEYVLADVYLHVPRGSNNRLNEKSANRDNADRLFDSQNNNRGGYNAGDKTASPAGNNEEKQYRMSYFQSGPEYKVSQGDQGKTFLTVEWTNQHGCGGNEDSDPHKQNCNLVFQYMCQDDINSTTGGNTNKHFIMRNGVNTATQNYNKPKNLNENQNNVRTRRNVVSTNKGLHERWEWYDKCYVRERNKGLFNADQILKGNNGLGYSAAIYTRQNPNGNRRGYECPEERDYYPYWHPTPWKDIAVLAENSSMCSHYTSKSFNTQPYHECLESITGGQKKHYSRWNNVADCESNGGEWTLLHNYLEKETSHNTESKCQNANTNDVDVTYIWAIPHDTITGDKECLVALDSPECEAAPWSRSNHLGNGRTAQANNYTWVIPNFPSSDTQRCVLRLRYNISTDDYDPYHTNASHNEDKANGIKSPVQQNPYVDIGAGQSPLRLAINTAQFGRVFQDRSHVFKLTPRPEGVEDKKVYNLNVRGKRGNIVQVYPAVEYDFSPNPLHAEPEDLVHIQWTGSNTHNNGQPAGDGQAGDAGEGTSGTDRSNMAQSPHLDSNYPLPYEQTTIWDAATVHWIYLDRTGLSAEDLALNLASSSYYECKTGCDARPGKKTKLNNLLNNAPASYPGVLLQFKEGEYSYICTRNNNFSNRSQKAKIVIK